MNDPQAAAQNLALFKVYTIYRSILSAILLLTFLLAGNDIQLGNLNPLLFIYTCSIYLAFNLVVLAIVLFRTPKLKQTQLFANFFIDIIAIVLLADATGGIASGLAILLMVIIAASSMVFSGQLAFLLAAIASIAILADTFKLITEQQANYNNFLPAGLLGLMLFATAYLIQHLARRIRSSQLQAEQSAADVSTLQQLNQLIVQRMRTGIVVSDNQGHIKITNQSANELLSLNHNSSELAQQQTLLHPTLIQQLQQWQQQPQYRSPSFKINETGPEIQVSFSALRQGPDTDILIFLEDNKLLAQRAQEMKLASLGRFTASIAHEIRNPLGAISHAAQLLQESDTLSDADHRMSEIIQKHSKRMNEIIENILDLSRRENPKPERIELNQWLLQFADEFKLGFGQSCEITINSSITPCEISIDASQLRQVLTNLVDNGLRYSKQQTGNASVYFDIHLNAATQLPELDIIDNGPGIDETAQAHLFEPFYTTETEGTGLGLYISRELCEVNQARLDYTRTDNGKSCFRLSFPHPERRLLPDR